MHIQPSHVRNKNPTKTLPYCHVARLGANKISFAKGTLFVVVPSCCLSYRIHEATFRLGWTNLAREGREKNKGGTRKWAKRVRPKMNRKCKRRRDMGLAHSVEGMVLVGGAVPILIF